MKCHVYDIDKYRKRQELDRIHAVRRHIDYVKQLKQQTELFKRVHEESRLIDYI